MSVQLPLLVTGIAGVAGYNAFQYFRGRFPGQVIGMRRVNNWPLSGDGIEPCDMYDREQLQRLFDKYEFRSVLNGEGTCALRACELDPPQARKINVQGINTLLDVIEQSDTRLVHVSIDLVFSGVRDGGYKETCPTDPVTIYGKTMVEAEDAIFTRRPQSCILRMSLPMGVSFNGHAGAIDWIQSRFQKNKPATLYFDEVRTPTYTSCLNKVFETVLANDMSGLYHSGGTRTLSLYEIAQIVNRIGGYDPDNLMGCSRIDAGPIPPRAGNVTMNSKLLGDALGFEPFDPWPFYDGHVPTHRQWHYERPADEPGSPKLLAETLYLNPRSNHIER
jgi:dTDP-4-dehydrorhamnose reductase